MVHGNNIFISLDEYSAPFACTKSNDIDTGCKAIEVSSPNTGDWEENIAGRKSWGFSVSWLVGSSTDIKNLLMVGNTYNITVISRGSSANSSVLTGSALCTAAKVTLTKGSIANGTFTFKGTGPLAEPSQ